MDIVLKRLGRPTSSESRVCSPDQYWTWHLASNPRRRRLDARLHEPLFQRRLRAQIGNALMEVVWHCERDFG